MGNFYSDIIELDPRFHSTKPVGDLNLLEPTMRALVRQIIHDAATLGFELMAFETYRSQERQEELFDQHATQLKKAGVHRYGLACDLVKVIGGAPSWKGDFTFLGRLAYQHKLIWGGDWGTPNQPHKSFDAVHVQRCSVARQAALFRGEWYPDENYDPYQDLGGVGGMATLMASVGTRPETSKHKKRVTKKSGARKSAVKKRRKVPSSERDSSLLSE